MSERIEKTRKYLREYLSQSPYFIKNPAQFSYRYQHSLRVAAIGAQIARADGLDEEELVLGCLLHDISYGRAFLTQEDWLNHGRESARIARPWLLELGISPEKTEEICYGIAIHVDDKADFPGEKTVLASLIGDCDDIDRFDIYRVYELLEVNRFSQKEIADQIAWLDIILPAVREYRGITLSSPTATALWRERLDFQIAVYENLYRQLTLPGDEWPDEKPKPEEKEDVPDCAEK